MQLSDAVLDNASFIDADLKRAILTGATAKKTDFTSCRLNEVSLKQAQLQGSIFAQANLNSSNLRNADFSAAVFDGSEIRSTDLTSANLTDSSIRGAIIANSILAGTNFTGVTMGWNVLASLDLSKSQGLDSVRHEGPTSLGIDSIERSGAVISRRFLLGAGVSDIFIDYMGSWIHQAIQFQSCFVSFSSKDLEFAERLYADLQNEGVRTWFAPKDLKIGEKFRTRIDEAIHVNDRLLLILSKSSINSSWVETEVEAALEKERIQKRIVLFPIRLDNELFDTNEAWAAEIRRSRHVGDFSTWKHHDSYQRSFTRLVRDLSIAPASTPANPAT